MVDSHCHLSDESFAADLPGVIARAREAGLTAALSVLAMGDADERARGLRALSLWPEVRLAIGAHPHQAGEYAAQVEDVAGAVSEAIDSLPATRAVGEIGLDYHYDFSPREVQRQVFRVQVALAVQRGLPMVIHTREAEDDTRGILEEICGGQARGVLHCFTGSQAFARWAVAFGLHISFSGIVTFPGAGDLRAVAAQVPAGRLLAETDSPYLAPVPFRGRRNEPAWVARVVQTLAEARGEDPVAIDRRLLENYVTLFEP